MYASILHIYFDTFLYNNFYIKNKTVYLKTLKLEINCLFFKIIF